MIDPRQNVEVNDETIAGKGFEHIKREITINEILYFWFKKCEASRIYVNGTLFKKEAMYIKQSLNLPELDGFKTSEDWLDRWKLSHGIKKADFWRVSWRL